MPELEKLDFNLRQALQAFEQSGARHDASAGITVSLRFEGDLEVIETLGFQTFTVHDNQARGIVWFKDIPALVAHPGVLWLEVGDEMQADTDTAVHDIRARASTASNVGSGGNGLWHAVKATGALTNPSNATGAGAIVAVIDTGIDYLHPAFMRQLTPVNKTRILRIWDQGLVATTASESPDPKLLLSDPLTYGVEYDNSEIDAALVPSATPLLHADCSGHGTHVAATAAGGVLFPTGGDAANVGVAPEADIIAVKLLDVPDSIRFGTSTAPGPEVTSDQRFGDAILYCLRTAADLGKPIVINLSLGNDFAPGDGLDGQAQFIDDRLDPTKAADGGKLQFPKGAVIVKTAGNNGTAARRQTAIFSVPANGSLTVPIELVDNRSSLDKKWKNCARRVHAPSAGVVFWYRRATPATAVKFAVRLPHQTAFNPDQGVGSMFESDFSLKPPKPYKIQLDQVHPIKLRHTIFLDHENNPAVTHPAGGSVHRHRVSMSLRPKQIVNNVSYFTGIYEVRITAPAGTKIYVLCRRSRWAPGKAVFCRIATKMQDGSAPAAEVTNGLTTDSSAIGTLGRHVVTVAAYNDTNGLSTHPDRHAIAEFSSRGPLRDFSDPSNPLPAIAVKPDIAAPGVGIYAAQSVNSQPPLVPRTMAWYSGIRFVEKSGTSMATPMVAGVVALMLEKKNDLNTTQVLTILKAAAAGRPGARPAVPADPQQTVTNAFGSGMIDALASHLNTP